MKDDALIRTPGEMLTAAREARGDPLGYVAERTKIPVPMLEALERDEYHLISDPLYVKSFLRSAATEVGLDPDELLDLYARATGGARPGAAPEAVWEEQTVTIHRVGVPWGRLLLAGAVLVVVVILGILLVKWLGGDDEPVEVPEPAAQAAEVVDHPARRESLLTATPAGSDLVDVDRDTLAGGRGQDAPPQDPTAEATTSAAEEAAAGSNTGAATEAEPEPVAVAARPGVPPTRPESAQPQTREPVPDRAAALPGQAGLALSGGHPRSQVLRVLTTAPVTVSVRRDGERRYTRFRIPGEGVGLPSLPRSDIEPGKAYAVAEGVVAYWGARDHFDLMLDRVQGVAISLNGRNRDLSRVRPGDELVLDAFHAPAPR